MRFISAILVGGFAAGVLDIVSAFSTYVPHGATAVGILQFIASGLIGAGAMKGGIATAGLGLLVHFGLTTMMAGIFVAVASRVPAVLTRPLVAGCVFGVLVCLAMTYAIVPISAVAKWQPATGWALVNALLGHCAYVGIPIAVSASHFLGKPAKDI